jgi:hypothetical protein
MVGFLGLEVNDESALPGLAQMLGVPYASWTSDRWPIDGRRAATP